MGCTCRMFAPPSPVRKNLSDAYEARETATNVAAPYSSIYFPRSKSSILTNTKNLSKNPGLQTSIAKHGYTPKPGAYLDNLKESRKSAPGASETFGPSPNNGTFTSNLAKKYANISASAADPRNILVKIRNNATLKNSNKSILAKKVRYEYRPNNLGENTDPIIVTPFKFTRSKTRKNKRSNRRRQSRRTRGY